MRAGWLIGGGRCITPNPSRMSLVRWLAAARNISGALEWQYSSRKWCSVSQTVEKPALSAASTSVRPSWNSWCSSSSPHGRGSGNS